MKNFFPATVLAIFSACILLISSCTDPLNVGAELLDEDRANVGFTDTLKLQARTIKGDSVRVFASNNALIGDFLFGRMADPYFGITEAAIYMEPLLARDLGGQYMEFLIRGQAVIDSIILILPLDSSAVFGDISGTFGIEVYQVTEPINVEADNDGLVSFYSNVSFETNPMPLASTNFTPSFDSVFIKEVINPFALQDTTSLILPHLRIPLDLTLGQWFLNQDTSIYANDSIFLDNFRGIYLKPTGISEGLLDLSLSNSWAGIHIFYTERGDTLDYRLELGTIGRRISQYTHEYTGAVVEQFLDDNTMGDSLLFLQGLQGLLVAFEIPELRNLDNKVINQAVLEFTVADFDDYDLEGYPPVNQIIALKRDNTGKLVTFDDVAVLPNNLDTYFGGQPSRQDDGSITYTFNISIHTQFIMDGTEPETIYLAVLPRPGNAGRVMLKGVAASSNAAVLKVSFTDI